jgi:hypothetical protein
MPTVRSPLGTFRFPDDMPMEQMDAELAQIHSQGAPQQPPQGGGIANALRSSFFGQQEQAPSILPVARVPGLSPQMGHELRQQLGAQKELDASTALRARAQQEQAIEKEKDRAKAFSLEKMRHDNQKNELEMRLNNSLAVAKHRSAMPKVQYDEESKTWFQLHEDPDTGASSWEPIKGQQPAPKATPPQRPTVVSEGGAVFPPGTTDFTKPAYVAPRTSAPPSPATLENAITTRMKFYAGYGRKDASGNVTPISADEAKQLAEAEFNNTAAASEVVDAGHLFPLPKGAAEKNIADLIRKDFTVNLRTSKTSDRFNTLSSKDHEDFAYESTATAYGMTVDEVKAALKGSQGKSPRNMGGMPIVQGSQPPAPAAPTAPAAAPQGVHGTLNGVPGTAMPDGSFVPDKAQ